MKGCNNMNEYEMNLKKCFIEEVLDCISEAREAYDINADFDNIIDYINSCSDDIYEEKLYFEKTAEQVSENLIEESAKGCKLI